MIPVSWQIDPKILMQLVADPNPEKARKAMTKNSLCQRGQLWLKSRSRASNRKLESVNGSLACPVSKRQSR